MTPAKRLSLTGPDAAVVTHHAKAIGADVLDRLAETPAHLQGAIANVLLGTLLGEVVRIARRVAPAKRLSLTGPDAAVVTHHAKAIGADVLDRLAETPAHLQRAIANVLLGTLLGEVVRIARRRRVATATPAPE